MQATNFENSLGKGPAVIKRIAQAHRFAHFGVIVVMVGAVRARVDRRSCHLLLAQYDIDEAICHSPNFTGLPHSPAGDAAGAQSKDPLASRRALTWPQLD